MIALTALSNVAFAVLAQSNSSGSVGGSIAGMIGFLIWLAIVVLVIVGMWKMFAKADQPGWASLIPIYNTYILCKIVGRPGWWTLLFFIPVVNLIIAIIVMLDLAKCFGKTPLFAVGLILLSPIFMCILGFGPAQYQGPVAGNA